MRGLYHRLERFFAHEADVAEMMQVLGVFDAEVIESFLAMGFTPKTAPAIEMAPLIFVAWASSSVTDQECAAALAEIHDSQSSEFPESMEVVYSWLASRPEPVIWGLWVRYIQGRIRDMSPAERDGLHRKLLRQARRIARASGGWMGIATICRQEHGIIDAIDQVIRWASLSAFPNRSTPIGVAAKSRASR